MTVPSIQAVQSVVDRLRPSDWKSAAMHLLTPTNVVVGQQAYPGVGDSWHYRGFEAPGLTVAHLWGLAVAGHREGDEYLDLEDFAANPWRLVKKVRSGAGVILTGLDCVLGYPDAYIAKGCPEATSGLISKAVLSGNITSQPIVVSDTPLVMLRRGRQLVVSPALSQVPSAISRKDSALKAATHAARLRQEWSSPVGMAEEGLAAGLVRTYRVESEGGDHAVVLTVGSGLVMEHPQDV